MESFCARNELGKRVAGIKIGWDRQRGKGSKETLTRGLDTQTDAEKISSLKPPTVFLQLLTFQVPIHQTKNKTEDSKKGDSASLRNAHPYLYAL